MGYNRYHGNTGRYERVEDVFVPPPPPPPPPPEGAGDRPFPPAHSRAEPGGLRLPRLDTEDLLILAVRWLLYRSSGEQEMLVALAAYLVL